MKTKLLLLCLFCTYNLNAQFTLNSNEKYAGYLFAHMTKDDYGSLYYSISSDGLKWDTLNSGKRVNEVYRGHPDICQGHDGRFYMIGVEKETGRSPLWVSSDLLTWKESDTIPRKVFTSFTGYNATDSWRGAPKMFFDELTKTYIITWHSPDRSIKREAFEDYWCSMRTFFVTTKDFKTYTETKRLFPFEFGTIDVIIRREGNIYYAIIKDECEATALWPTGKSIRVCVSHSLTGPYSYPGPSISPNYREAPTVIPKLDGSGWLLYYEQYPGVQYGLSAAPSINGPWYDIWYNNYSVPSTARHGCMIPITQKQYDALLEKY